MTTRRQRLAGLALALLLAHLSDLWADDAPAPELMVEYGMSPAAALAAATSVAAKVLGRSGDLGRIAPGHAADLVAVDGNPLADVSSLGRPVVVIQDGRLAVDRRE